MSRSGITRAAAVVLAVAMMALMGCNSTPAPAPALSVKAVDGSQKAVAGTNLTFFMKVKNSQKVLDTVALSVQSQPAGWSAALGCSTLDIAPGASKGTVLEVSVPAGAPAGTYSVNVRAASTLRGFSATGSVKVSVREGFGQPLDLAHNGSTVKVDYTGYLGSFEIFDTSVKAIGSDQAFPKSSSFKVPLDNEYQPLTFEVGKGQMIKGFDAAVVGMGAGQSKTIRVPPEEGYGVFETTLVNLTETFPMHKTMPRLNFTITYGEEPVANKVVLEPWWGWKVQVVDSGPETVSLMTLPEINSTLFPYGWETRVVEVNGSADGGIGRITVRHYPGTGGNVTVRGMKAEVTELTPTAASIKYNLSTGNVLATQDLYFSIRVVSIG